MRKSNTMQKMKLTIFVDFYRAERLQELANEYKTSLGGAVERLIYFLEQTKQAQIRQLQSEVPPAAPSYKEVREEKIIEAFKNPMEDPKWAFLHAKPEDPNLKSVVKLRRTKKCQ
jgi:hypothetical protein